MKNVYRVNLFFFIVMITGLFSGFIMSLLPMKFAEAVSQYIFLLIPVFIYIIITKKDFKSTLRLNKLKAKDVIIVSAVAIAMQPFILFINSIIINLVGNQVDVLFSEIDNYSFLFNLFTIAITPAICEELVLRGVILDGYKGIDIRKAALINGFLFGIFHMNIQQFSYAFFMGILLAYVVYITDSIYSSMIIHFINNSLSVVSTELTKGMNSNANQNIDITISLVIFAIISIATVVFLIKKLIKSNNKDMSKFDSLLNKQKIINWPIIVSTIVFLVTSILITLAQNTN